MLNKSFDGILENIHSQNLSTHMPFIYNESILLFCIGFDNSVFPDKSWRISYIDTQKNIWSVINTGLKNDEYTIECSPTAYFDKIHNRIVVCFLATTKNNPEYRMYRLFGKSFDTLSTAYDGGIVSYHGFINEKLFVRTIFQQNDDIHINIYKKSGETQTLIAINQYIHKVSYISEQPEKIIVSLQKKENPKHAKEIIIDTNDYGYVDIISKNTHKLYKSSIFDGTIAYAKKLSGFDKRQIDIKNNFNLKREPISNHLYFKSIH